MMQNFLIHDYFWHFRIKNGLLLKNSVNLDYMTSIFLCKNCRNKNIWMKNSSIKIGKEKTFSIPLGDVHKIFLEGNLLAWNLNNQIKLWQSHLFTTRTNKIYYINCISYPNHDPLKSTTSVNFINPIKLQKLPYTINLMSRKKIFFFNVLRNRHDTTSYLQ